MKKNIVHNHFNFAACLILIAAMLVLPLGNCTSAINNQEERITPSQQWNDLARFLAGMPVGPESRYNKEASLPGYRKYAASMDQFFDRVKKENIDLITPWRDANIPERVRKNTVIYPLSGADFINLYTFFPEAGKYIMLSVETQGPIPDPLKLSPAELQSGLTSMQRCVSTIASLNYLYTALQRSETKNPHLPGFLPILMVFSARLNLSITNVELIALDKEGLVVPLETAGQQPAITGARITFVSPKAKSTQELCYLSMRVRPTVDSDSVEGKFLNRLHGINTFMKSAIYLLQLESFRNFCNFLMNRSDMIIEDYSAIPYGYFNPAEWDIRLYGTYTRSAGFSNYPNPIQQHDMAQAYRSVNNPLPFNFGYGALHGKGRSNLMLMLKKQPGGKK